MPFEPPAITSGQVVDHVQLGPVTLTEAIHPPGMEIPLHAHPAPCLTYVVGGSFTETVDGVDYRCTAGDVLLKPQDAAHANHYGQNGGHSFVVEIPGTVIFTRLRHRPGVVRPRVFDDGRLTLLMARFHEETRYRDELSSLVVEELLAQVLKTITDAPGQTLEPDRTSVPEWLWTVYERVRNEFRKKPSLSDLASQAGVHPHYLSRVFADRFGSPIGRQVRRWRVEYAARKVRTTGRGLAAIAYDAGFSDQSHMTRQMRRHLGVTPGRLRGG